MLTVIGRVLHASASKLSILILFCDPTHSQVESDKPQADYNRDFITQRCRIFPLDSLIVYIETEFEVRK